MEDKTTYTQEMRNLKKLLTGQGVRDIIPIMRSLHKIYFKNSSVNSNSPTAFKVNIINLSRREKSPQDRFFIF